VSLDELQSDFAANSAQIKALDPTTSTTSDLVKLIKFTLWPFVQNMVMEMSEIDDAMQDVIDNAEDILQEETAGLFAGVMLGAAALIAELEKRLTLPADAKLVKSIRDWKAALVEANTVLAEITIETPEPPKDEGRPPDEGDEDDEDGDEDDDDHEDDDDEETK